MQLHSRCSYLFWSKHLLCIGYIRAAHDIHVHPPTTLSSAYRQNLRQRDIVVNTVLMLVHKATMYYTRYGNNTDINVICSLYRHLLMIVCTEVFPLCSVCEISYEISGINFVVHFVGLLQVSLPHLQPISQHASSSSYFHHHLLHTRSQPEAAKHNRGFCIHELGEMLLMLMLEEYNGKHFDGAKRIRPQRC